jgi:hypothetical protein
MHSSPEGLGFLEWWNISITSPSLTLAGQAAHGVLVVEEQTQIGRAGASPADKK